MKQVLMAAVLSLTLCVGANGQTPDREKWSAVNTTYRQLVFAFREPTTRANAADDLAALARKVPQVVAALRVALHDPDPEVRAEAAYALSGFGPAAYPALDD